MSTATTTLTYEIVVAEGNPDDEFYGTRSGNWTNQLGDDNEFPSVAAAEEGIDSLIALGGEWETPSYAVRRIGDRYPL